MHRVSAPMIPSGPCSPVMTLPLIDTVSRFMSFHSCASSDLPRPRADVWAVSRACGRSDVKVDTQTSYCLILLSCRHCNVDLLDCG